jgi:anti-sigma regulatory factor (Ser/Thr protein kinase)
MGHAVVESPRRWWLRLAADVTAPRTARELVARACVAGHAEHFLDLGQLVISELVTNAVRHSGTAIEVEVRLERDRLFLRVHDEGDGVPAIVPPELRTIGGVGLALVDQAAESWGVTPDPRGGKDVWCVLAAGSAGNGAVNGATY